MREVLSLHLGGLSCEAGAAFFRLDELLRRQAEQQRAEGWDGVAAAATAAAEWDATGTEGEGDEEKDGAAAELDEEVLYRCVPSSGALQPRALFVDYREQYVSLLPSASSASSSSTTALAEVRENVRVTSWGGAVREHVRSTERPDSWHAQLQHLEMDARSFQPIPIWSAAEAQFEHFMSGWAADGGGGGGGAGSAAAMSVDGLSMEARESLVDATRVMLEECDMVQGFQIMTDVGAGFGGLGAFLTRELADECRSAPRFVQAILPDASARGRSRTWQTVQLMNRTLALHALLEHASLVVPVSEATLAAKAALGAFHDDSRRPGGAGHRFYTASALAAVTHTASIPWRASPSYRDPRTTGWLQHSIPCVPGSMHDVCMTATAGGRLKLCTLATSVPLCAATAENQQQQEGSRSDGDHGHSFSVAAALGDTAAWGQSRQWTENALVQNPFSLLSPLHPTVREWTLGLSDRIGITASGTHSAAESREEGESDGEEQVEYDAIADDVDLLREEAEADADSAYRGQSDAGPSRVKTCSPGRTLTRIMALRGLSPEILQGFCTAVANSRPRPQPISHISLLTTPFPAMSYHTVQANEDRQLTWPQLPSDTAQAPIMHAYGAAVSLEARTSMGSFLRVLGQSADPIAQRHVAAEMPALTAAGIHPDDAAAMTEDLQQQASAFALT